MSSRPISSAKNGLPPVISHSWVSCGRESSSPRSSLRMPNSGLAPSGPTARRSAAPEASPRSSSPAPERAVISAPTGSLPRRRSANSKVRADAVSSHWKSSTATTTGASAESALRLSSTARPTARGSGAAWSPAPSMRSAASSARRRRSPSDGSTSATMPASSSEMPANESTASASTATCDEDPGAARPRSLEPCLPERGLPDSGRPRQHQHRRGCGRACEEVVDRPGLRLAPSELARHGPRPF